MASKYDWDIADSLMWPDAMDGRELYHAAPLHYLPSILNDRALYAKSVLAARGIAPRATARRRDSMLSLQDYVHLSFKPHTPLLADKLAKGYPHAMLIFEAGALARMPAHALLAHNTKAWKSRAACLPVSDTIEKARLLKRYGQFRELQSLEFLVKYGIGLENLLSLVFVSRQEADWVRSLCDSIGIELPPAVRIEECLASVGYTPATRCAIEEYFADCRRVGSVLTPPADIPFD